MSDRSIGRLDEILASCTGDRGDRNRSLTIVIYLDANAKKRHPSSKNRGFCHKQGQ